MADSNEPLSLTYTKRQLDIFTKIKPLVGLDFCNSVVESKRCIPTHPTNPNNPQKPTPQKIIDNRSLARHFLCSTDF